MMPNRKTLLGACIVLLLLMSAARGEWCNLRPMTRMDADDGKEWRWTMLEGRKCWYRARRKLPKDDLLWEYDAEEFNEGGIVTGRKYYTPEELKR